MTAKAKSQIITLTCRHCQRRYNARWDATKPEKNSRCCGRTPCFELENWTQKDWDARRELAEKQFDLDPERIQYQWFDHSREVMNTVDTLSDPLGPLGGASLRA